MDTIVSRVLRNSVIRYGLTGVLTVAVDVGGLVALHQVCGVEVYLAATISFLASLGVNFTLNKFWTFGAKTHTPQQAILYSALIVLNYATGIAMIDAFTALGLGYVYGKVAALILTTTWNYLLYKKVIFIEHPVGDVLNAGVTRKKMV